METVALPPHIDVNQFCQLSQELRGVAVMAAFERLMQETQGLEPANPVDWLVRGEMLNNPMGQSQQQWLHLTVTLNLSLTCQRCLGPVTVPVRIDRSFRFVETESQADLEDEASVEDVLTLSRDFDLAALVEDEVLMDLPVVPRHDVCPVDVKLVAVDADFETSAVKPNPFAALADLKRK